MKSKIFISLIVCCFGLMNLTAQENESRFKVSGQIIDARTNKPVKKMPITVMPFNKVVEANNTGKFLFNMPVGTYSFVIDYYPFDKQEVKLNLQSDTTLLIKLQSPFASQYIEEIEVISSKLAVEEPASMERLDAHTFRNLPAIIGERDILKAFSLTAGVTSSSEGAADMQVRGGTHGQNLYLLDGIPLFSTDHFFGLVSAYNPTIIRSAKLYKSDFPVEFGGKISSVLNVLTEDANLTKFKGEAEIGMLTSKLVLNFPLIKDKLALSVAGRISNYSIANLVSPLLPESTGTRFGVHFGDLNSNLVWKISEKDKLKLTFFSNTDGINVNTTYNTEKEKTWIDNFQQNIGLNWYRTISETAENHLMVYADRYGYDFGVSQIDEVNDYKYIGQALTGVNSTGLEDKFKYNLSDQWKLNAGASVKLYGFSPFQININDSNITSIQSSTQTRMIEGIAFAGTDYELSKNQNLSAGLRFSGVGNKDKSYFDIEPRFGYHGIFKNDYSISASVGRMTQPIHRVANSGLGFPFQLFFPSSSYLKPETSWNFSVGGAKDFSWKKSKFSVKADVWYKSMNNIVDFKDGNDAVFTTIVIPQETALKPENYITQGKGKAYGIDFSADYSLKNFKFTADYTLMRAVNQFDDLNYGRPFDASTDIRNSLSLTSEIKLSDSWSFSATWQYMTGKPITVPTSVYLSSSANGYYAGYHYYSNTDFVQVITERNNYRTKAFHKLDVSFTHTYKAFKKYNGTISLGLYNAYNQANPFLYYLGTEQTSDNSYKPTLNYLSVFPILPSFNWSVKF
ncbi:MAG: carboxypeptidase-like regulatory domain-containing protein [Paludibacter sp.]|nr:carboxypeptidase-like regulatory domain-containing protein [Paludibacter sp.]